MSAPGAIADHLQSGSVFGRHPINRVIYAIFQMAEVAISHRVFAAILTMINGLRGPPHPTVST